MKVCGTKEEMSAKEPTDGRAFVEDVYRVMQDYCFDMLDSVESAVRARVPARDEAAVKRCVDVLAQRLQQALDTPFDAFETAVLPLFEVPRCASPVRAGAARRRSCVPVSDVVVDEDVVEDTFDTAKQHADFEELQDILNVKAHERALLQQQLQQRQHCIRLLEAQLRTLEALSVASLGAEPRPIDAPTFVDRITALQQRTAALRALLPPPDARRPSQHPPPSQPL